MIGVMYTTWEGRYDDLLSADERPRRPEAKEAHEGDVRLPEKDLPHSICRL